MAPKDLEKLLRYKKKREARKRNAILEFDVTEKLQLVSKELRPIATELVAYMTENRLRAVLSKESQVTSLKEKPRIVGLFVKDAFEDYRKDHPDFEFTDNKDRKEVTSVLSGYASHITTTNFPKILAGEF
eukprot:TRINITY_DN17360_c0_g1_i1.p1 TRINITY_DN17360_c0_g1~~TRINITY_DN17360_c0_g1_i1.p1  ORF type:complete len:130 (-),score=27.85 TRINITY_DN17360_c0_g1_i1:22-411(-)